MAETNKTVFEILEQLAGIHGPSGREEQVAAAIAELARPYADEITTDVLGNLIVHKKGAGAKLMFAAHMDSIGLIATHVEDNGMIRVGELGGVHAEQIRNAMVRFENGTMAAVKVNGDADEKDLKLEDLYLDLGASGREEALKQVQPGDTAVYTLKPQMLGRRIAGSYLDNRISCAILLKALAELGQSDNDVYFVFTVQEEVGTRGAGPAAFGIDPAYAVAVDVIGSKDWPGAKKTGSSVLGGGAAIKLMDHSVICHPTMVKKLTALAEEKDIPHQMDVSTVGGTDAGVIHRNRAGVITGGISIPCRYTHSPSEMVDLTDVEACVELVKALAAEAL